MKAYSFWLQFKRNISQKKHMQMEVIWLLNYAPSGSTIVETYVVSMFTFFSFPSVRDNGGCTFPHSLQHRRSQTLWSAQFGGTFCILSETNNMFNRIRACRRIVCRRRLLSNRFVANCNVISKSFCFSPASRKAYLPEIILRCFCAI